MNSTPSPKNPTPSDSIREAIQALQDELGTLRVAVKYLCFDLEATRRENEELRRQLEER